MGAKTARDILRPVQQADELARFAPDLLLADRWFIEAGKAHQAGDHLTAETYRERGERIHDRIEKILTELQQEALR